MYLSEITSKYDYRGGIYLIKCLATNKAYLGSANEMVKRLKTHYRQLKGNKHPNLEMQADYNQYGDASFTAEAIKLVHSGYDRNLLYSEEQAYLNVVNGWRGNYYNKSYKASKTTAQLSAVKDFIRKHIDPYKASYYTCDTFDNKTVISWAFIDNIVHYHTINHL
jgi:group I intron endonuclease